jgi:phosphoribosyl-AMP cyclohydrolase
MHAPVNIQLIGNEVAIAWDGRQPRPTYTCEKLRAASPSAANIGERDILGNQYGGDGPKRFPGVDRHRLGAGGQLRHPLRFQRRASHRALRLRLPAPLGCRPADCRPSPHLWIASRAALRRKDAPRHEHLRLPRPHHHRRDRARRHAAAEVRRRRPDSLHHVQDVHSGEVLMFAFMNAESLAHTLRTGRPPTGAARARNSGSRARSPATRSSCGTAHRLRPGRAAAQGRASRRRRSCHNGYKSCFYRKLADLDAAATGDYRLAFTAERLFDPATVYRKK